MREVFLTLLLVLSFAGCTDANRKAASTSDSQRRTTTTGDGVVVENRTAANETAANRADRASAEIRADRDNTGINVRDRDAIAKTPIDQNENKADIDITANIRKRVVDTKMSVNAQNVKIITQNGKVTLRGPVKTAEERSQIEKIAVDVAGAGNVENLVEVEERP